MSKPELPTENEKKVIARLLNTDDGKALFGFLQRRLCAFDVATRKMVADNAVHVRSHVDGQRAELGYLIDLAEEAKGGPLPEFGHRQQEERKEPVKVAPPKPLDPWRRPR